MLPKVPKIDKWTNEYVSNFLKTKDSFGYFPINVFLILISSVFLCSMILLISRKLTEFRL